MTDLNSDTKFDNNNNYSINSDDSDNNSNLTSNISVKSDNNYDKTTNDEILSFLSKIQNKYSSNAEQKHLNQMYDIGILCVNKKFNQQKLVQSLTKIIDERSKDPIRKVRDNKRASLIAAFKQGILDASS